MEKEQLERLKKDYKDKVPFYLSDSVMVVLIMIATAMWVFGIIFILPIVIFMEIQRRKIEWEKMTEEVEKYVKEEQVKILTDAEDEASRKLEDAREESTRIIYEAKKEEEEVKRSIGKYRELEEEVRLNIAKLGKEEEKSERGAKTATNKLNRLKVMVDGIENLDKELPGLITNEKLKKEIKNYIDTCREYCSGVELGLHYKDSKELRKQMNAKLKELSRLMVRYQGGSEKEKEIYEVIKLSVQSELQNIMYSLKEGKKDVAVTAVKGITNRYLSIINEGSTGDALNITRFLFEVEPLFLDMVEIEYSYYRRKAEEREEQRELREQMRQEAAEKKLLAEEKKRLEREEEKFEIELQRNREQLEMIVAEEEREKLLQRIYELENQKEDLVEEKEEVTKRVNGKAGYVYIVSNEGSFGKDVYKIGMTRRIEPMDRVNELSGASVPFKFDVHALIFSKDAVGLESELHERLSSKRVNKVNLRKEFFRESLDNLQEIVEEIDETVDFKRTVLAEEYNLSK